MPENARPSTALPDQTTDSTRRSELKYPRQTENFGKNARCPAFFEEPSAPSSPGPPRALCGWGCSDSSAWRFGSLSGVSSEAALETSLESSWHSKSTSAPLHGLYRAHSVALRALFSRMCHFFCPLQPHSNPSLGTVALFGPTLIFLSEALQPLSEPSPPLSVPLYKFRKQQKSTPVP